MALHPPFFFLPFLQKLIPSVLKCKDSLCVWRVCVCVHMVGWGEREHKRARACFHSPFLTHTEGRHKVFLRVFKLQVMATILFSYTCKMARDEPKTKI